MDSLVKRKLCRFLKGWGYSFIIALLIATSVKSSLADWNDIPTGSMEPTILIGDRVLVNKLAYDFKIPYTTTHLAQWANPKRGDIVVFYSPADGTWLIKRVAGLPGDTLAMVKNRLFINGEPLTYAAVQPDGIDQASLGDDEQHVFLNEKLDDERHTMMLSPARPSLNSFAPLTIPAGHYFMLGDNRDNSADSRFFGFVERQQIVGRATMIVMSRQDSFLHPRWSRFFKDLI